jgi:hypothetical protein
MPWYDIQPVRLPLARVFVQDNIFCPHDQHAYFDEPGLTTPFYDEVHISCTFTWDRQRAIYLQEKWTHRGSVVKIGGPAFGSPATDFIPGLYTDLSVTFMTRGCVRHCKACFVPTIEGAFRELQYIHPASIIQDNNLLASSDAHWDRVMAMLRTRHTIKFKGGLDVRLLSPKRIADLAAIRRHIAELFVACDKPGDLSASLAGITALKAAGFPRWKLRCYVIIGADMVEEEDRLRKIFAAGAIPFAQLLRDPDDKLEYSQEWRKFQKTWCRPPATKSHCKKLGIL